MLTGSGFHMFVMVKRKSGDYISESILKMTAMKVYRVQILHKLPKMFQLIP